MTELLLLKIILSFVVGGLFVAGCTAAAERFGTHAGGVIGGIPSTIAVALLSIGLISGPRAASEATDVIPLVVGFNGLFLVGFAVFARRGLLPGLGGGLVVWFLLSLAVVLSGFRDFVVSVGVFFLLFFVSDDLLRRRLNLPAYGGARVRPTIRGMLARAVLSGTVIALAGYSSTVAGPIVGGLLSVFPAVFVSTLFITARAQGIEFARALTGPLLVSGMINVAVYGVCVRYLYPGLGLALGTIGAFAVSLTSAYGTYRLVRSRLRTGDAPR